MIQRDTNLDTCRALVMILIVCITHMFAFKVGNDFVHSILLFEMPAIFFIAGAAQQITKKQRGFKETVINRTKRLILPFYAFIIVLYLWLALMTLVADKTGRFDIDITSLSFRDVLKTLVTGGCVHIPIYGYTWFISCYMIISCSLPLQVKLLKHVPSWIYLAFWVLVTLVLTPLHFSAEIEIKNLPVYNFFFIAGYLYYKHKPTKWFYAIFAASTVFTVYGFIKGFMHPMQGHKFPADIYFLIFGTAWMCFFCIVLRKIKLPYNRFLDIWNVRGYNIYLYQTITFYIIYRITLPWISSAGNQLTQFIILSLLALVINTMSSYITFNIEKYLCKGIIIALKKVFNKYKNGELYKKNE